MGDFSSFLSLRSMKKLNWDTIPSQRVLGKLNVWTSSRPQRDLVLDIRSMEELFSHVDKRASLCTSTNLKKCDGTDHLPQEPQVKLLMSFSGNLSVLAEADKFMVQLVKVPGYEERLKMMVLREEFFPLMEEVKNSVGVMSKAANELLDCDDLHSVIRLVLKAGNYMNAGGYNSNVIGFRMTSLLKLADTKANKPGMNLMHYVAKQAEYIDSELLTFPNQLEHIGMASRICKEEVISDFEREVKKIKEVKLYSSRHPGLIQQMETFLIRAEAKLAEVESSLQELKSVSNAVAEYFCEDPSTFKLEECCSIFHSFCKRFDTAVQENREREEAERRHKRKESMRIAPKRRSTASGPNGESSSLESALHNFLSTVPEGLARCRKNALPPIEGSPSECSSRTDSSVETSEQSPRSNQDGHKKPFQAQKEDKDMTKLENKEAEKMEKISLNVLSYQKNTKNTLATPKTPRPRTRDYFFASNGDVSSPWTILSPFTYTQKTSPQRNRPAHQRRLSSTYGGDNLDDGVWKSDEGNDAPKSVSETSPSRGSGFLPECPNRRGLSQGTTYRSHSVDEAVSFSSGSRTESVTKEVTGISKAGNNAEGQVSTSGFISFFRRIGGRSKPSTVGRRST
uniref:FH2 domain-containing protein 1-like n=1 Tax=Pundamilia nyererei TaxID=303518 RepID=A0A3B4H9Y4_9CICH